MEQLNFQQDVIERSHEVPVVVDFWAPWCGPCRVLGPNIEQLAEEAAGTWELVKVNTEEERSLAQTYQIMSIPAVKLFYQGEIIGEFTGALPKAQIRKWLEGHLPDERKDQLATLRAQLSGAERAAAIQQLENFVEQHPDMEEARLLLAMQVVHQKPLKAQKLVENIGEGHHLYELAEDVRNISTFYLFEGKDDIAVASKLMEAREAASKQDMESLLKKLIEAVMIDKTYQNDLPRKSTIAFFRFLGDEHALTKKYRPRFNMALY